MISLVGINDCIWYSNQNPDVHHGSQHNSDLCHHFAQFQEEGRSTLANGQSVTLLLSKTYRGYQNKCIAPFHFHPNIPRNFIELVLPHSKQKHKNTYSEQSYIISKSADTHTIYVELDELKGQHKKLIFSVCRVSIL